MKRNNENGVIALFMAVVIGLLLVTATTAAARLSVNELGQSSQVDRSEQAYYAAEAGVEEAVRRIDLAATTDTIQTIFPEQFPDPLVNPTLQTGDRFMLAANDFTSFPAPQKVVAEGTEAEWGDLSWRNRKVYQQSSAFAGVQVKDESTEYDTSDLRRRCATQQNDLNGSLAGPGPAFTPNWDYCRNQSIFANFKGLEYCWTPTTSDVPLIELTDVSWTGATIASPSGITTNKTMLNNLTAYVRADGATVKVISGAAVGEKCLQFLVPASAQTSNSNALRYLFRIKPVYPGLGSNQGNASIKFRAQVLETIAQPAYQQLFIPNSAYYIDVIGQSGDIKRRVIAKKQRNGRLIGIFDYVLYSGDSTTPLCKMGVNQTDVSYNFCAVSGAAN